MVVRLRLKLMNDVGRRVIAWGNRFGYALEMVGSKFVREEIV